MKLTLNKKHFQSQFNICWDNLLENPLIVKFFFEQKLIKKINSKNIKHFLENFSQKQILNHLYFSWNNLNYYFNKRFSIKLKKLSIITPLNFIFKNNLYIPNILQELQIIFKLITSNLSIILFQYYTNGKNYNKTIFSLKKIFLNLQKNFFFSYLIKYKFLLYKLFNYKIKKN